jgi:hypothetical protein
MSKKTDKNTFGGEIVNRFSLLTNEGKKKLNEESKKNDKSNKPKKSEITQFLKKKKKDVVDISNDDIIIPEKSANNELLFNFDFENGNQKKFTDPNNNLEEQDNVIDRDENEGKNNYLNSQWTVWVHRNDCEDWSITSYQNVFLIDSIASFWEFFNNFYLMNKEDNQYFIMRNKIKPKWEDNNNRNGGICSLKMDCYDRNSKFDVGTEIMVTLCILIMNETFIQENTEINGISYSVKSRSVYIKIWTKEYKNDIKDKLPKNLMNKFNNVVRNHVYRKFENNISVRYTQIEPEHDDEN